MDVEHPETAGVCQRPMVTRPSQSCVCAVLEKIMQRPTLGSVKLFPRRQTVPSEET